jgi:hypothetical protein
MPLSPSASLWRECGAILTGRFGSSKQTSPPATALRAIHQCRACRSRSSLTGQAVLPKT